MTQKPMRVFMVEPGGRITQSLESWVFYLDKTEFPRTVTLKTESSFFGQKDKSEMREHKVTQQVCCRTVCPFHMATPLKRAMIASLVLIMMASMSVSTVDPKFFSNYCCNFSLSVYSVSRTTLGHWVQFSFTCAATVVKSPKFSFQNKFPLSVTQQQRSTF